MDWNIEPFVAVGPVRFGASPSEVRAIFKRKPKTVRTTPLAANLTDAYQTIGVMIEYELENRVRSVEMIAPCKPHLGEITFFDQPAYKVEKAIKGLGTVFDCWPDSLGIRELGLMIKVIDGTVKLVSVFSRSEWDRLLEQVKTLEEKRAARAAKRRLQPPPPNPFK